MVNYAQTFWKTEAISCVGLDLRWKNFWRCCQPFRSVFKKTWKSIHWKGKSVRSVVMWIMPTVLCGRSKVSSVYPDISPQSDYPGYFWRSIQDASTGSEQVDPYLHACLNQGFSGVRRETSSPCRGLHLAEEKGNFLPGWHGTVHRGPKTRIQENIRGRKNTIASRTMCWPID